MMLLVLTQVARSPPDGNPDVWIIDSFHHLHGSQGSHNALDQITYRQQSAFNSSESLAIRPSLS